MIKQLIRALGIKDSAVTIDLDETDELQYIIVGSSDPEGHFVTCRNGVWRCTCDDYIYAKDKQLGSYTCKHILKAILFSVKEHNKGQRVLEDWFK